MSIIGAAHFEHGRQLPFGNWSTDDPPDSQVETAAKRGGNYGIYNKGALLTWTMQVPDGLATFHLGFAAKLVETGTSTTGTVVASVGWPNTISSGQTNNILIVRRPLSGDVLLYIGGGPNLANGPVLGSVPALWIDDGAWHWITLDFNCFDSGGIANLGFDGVQVITFTGDTKYISGNPTGAQALHFSSFSGNSGSATRQAHYLDDLIMTNSAGTINNSTVPEAIITPLPVNGSAGPNNFVGSDADSVDNHLHVDEVPFSAADWNQSSTVGHRDVYDVTNLTGSGATGNVLGIGVGASLQKTGPGPRTVNLGINSGGAASDSPAIGVPEADDYFQHWADLNPDTGSPWTYGAVDAMTVETEVV